MGFGRIIPKSAGASSPWAPAFGSTPASPRLRRALPCRDFVAFQSLSSATFPLNLIVQRPGISFRENSCCQDVVTHSREPFQSGARIARKIKPPALPVWRMSVVRQPVRTGRQLSFWMKGGSWMRNIVCVSRRQATIVCVPQDRTPG